MATKRIGRNRSKNKDRYYGDKIDIFDLRPESLSPSA
jgi:hypothetical protein